MGLINQDLWFRIASFDLESGDPEKPFFKRLMQEQQWTPEYAMNAITEYKKFCYLVCVSDAERTPSKVIDLVWHQHLQFTRNYWDEFCDGVLLRRLHHHPGNGSQEDKERFKTAFAGTLLKYQEEFDAPPPKEWWMQTRENLRRQQFEYVAPRFFLIPKILHVEWYLFFYCAGALFLGIVLFGKAWVEGSEFLKSIGALFLTFFLPYAALIIWNSSPADAGDQNGGCGSGCSNCCCGGCGGD